MTKQELKAKIDKLENGIKSKATPSNLIAPLKAQKAKLEKELEEMESAEKKAVKTKKVSKVAEKIKAAKKSVAKKTPAKAPAKEERKKDNIARDGDRKSLPSGKRISKTGKVYYETRANRSDKQTSKKPYLADGGEVSKKYVVFFTRLNNGKSVPRIVEMYDNETDAKEYVENQKKLGEKGFKIKQAKDMPIYSMINIVDKSKNKELKDLIHSKDKVDAFFEGKDSFYKKDYGWVKPYGYVWENWKLVSAPTETMEKGGDVYDDMNEDIEFANKKAKKIANSLESLGYKVMKVQEADYDTDAQIDLSEKVNVQVGLEGDLSIVIEKEEGKFTYIDCGKSYATLLQKLPNIDKQYMEKGGKTKRTVKLTLSDKDSYDYTYKQDGATASITFGFGKEPFQYEVKKISKSLEPLQQDILDTFTLQGIKQHDYKGGFSEAIKHLDTSILENMDDFAKGGSTRGNWILRRNIGYGTKYKELTNGDKIRMNLGNGEYYYGTIKGQEILWEDGIKTNLTTSFMGSNANDKEVLRFAKGGKIKMGDIVKIKNPLPDEDPNQLYLVIQEEIEKFADDEQIDIRVLNEDNKWAYPPIISVEKRDLEIVNNKMADGGETDKDIDLQLEKDMNNAIKKRDEYQLELKNLLNEKSQDSGQIEYLKYEIESLNKLSKKLHDVRLKRLRDKALPNGNPFKRKMADGGEIDWGADLGGGFSVGNDVYITDPKSLFQGKTGFVVGVVGRDLLVTILDNANERSVVVSKKGVEKLDAPEYAKGGYVIFEGHDHYNDKPLYKVISKYEDNDYEGEFHDNREDAEKELNELKNKDMNYAKGGEVKVGDILTANTGVKVKVVEYDPKFGGRVRVERIDEYATGKPSVFMPLSRFKMAYGGYMADGGEIYSLAENMTDSEYENKLSRLNEKQKRTYESLVRLGDSPKLALATTLLSNDVKWSDETTSAYTMAKGGKTFSERDLKEVLSLAVYHLYRGLNEVEAAMNYLDKTGQGGLKNALYNKLKLGYLEDSIKKIDYYTSDEKEKGGYMARGGKVPAHFGSGKNINVFGYQTENFDICGTAVKEFESAIQIMDNGKEIYKESLAKCAKYIDSLFAIEKYVVENEDANDSDFYEAISNVMSASIYNYRAEMSINLFSFVPQHLKEIAVRLAKAEKGGLYALGGMTAGRWYKDKSGEEFKFIGRVDSGANKGRFLFTDGQKSVYKDLEEFEGGKPKETKLFGFFEDGGSVAEGNYEMLMSNIKAIKHHAEELAGAVTPDTEIEAWVLSKSERAETDLSDITHYLDGLKMEKGGYMAKGGETGRYKIFQDTDGRIEQGFWGVFDTKENYLLDIFEFKKEAEGYLKEVKEKGANDADASKYNGQMEKYFKKGGYMAKGGKLKIGGEDFSYLLELSDKELSKRLDLVRKQQDVNGKQYFEAKSKNESTQKIEDSRKNLDNQERAIIEARVRKMAKGGSIPNNYEGKTEEEVWNSWNYDQKFHFLSDHYDSKFNSFGIKYKDLSDIAQHSSYDDLPNNIAREISYHISLGQYAKGGYMAEGGETSSKNFNTQYNVGRAKYVINYHDGKKTHKDGSPFYDLATFKNMKDFMAYKKKLKSEGYKEYKDGGMMAKGGKLKVGDVYKRQGFGKLKITKIDDGKVYFKYDDDDKELSEAIYSAEGKLVNKQWLKVDDKMAMGGKVKFADKVKAVQESLLKRKKVAPQVQKDYGKTYNKAEAKESAQRIVGSRMAQLKEKMAKKKK